MALIEEFQERGNFLFRHRSILPIPLLLLGIGIHVYIHLKLVTPLPENYFYFICLAVSFFGLLIRFITVGYTPKNTSGRNTKQQVADVVNTTAMYSIVRHPLYLGNYFMWLGVAMVTYDFWFVVAFTLAFWVYYERIMYAEEAFLRGKFGDSYLAWANKVPAFIPNFRLWKSSEAFFSFRNSVKREYLGFFKMVLILFMFEYTHEIMLNGFKYDQLSLIGKIWFIIFIVTLVKYLIIRTIKKNTTWLNVEGR